MRLTITFSEAPTVTAFCAVLNGVADAYRGLPCMMVEPTDQLTVVIEVKEPAPLPSGLYHKLATDDPAEDLSSGGST
jgi:hypothetical protein